MKHLIKIHFKWLGLLLISGLLVQGLAAQEPDFTPDEPPVGSEPAEPPDTDPGSPPDTDPPAPPSSEPAIAFFGNDLYVFPGEEPGTSQWYFSFTFKDLYHFTGGNWFYAREFKSYMWVAVSTGSPADGFWSYHILPDHSSWVYTRRDGNFHDLRDSNRDGENDLTDDQAGVQLMAGYMYLQTPFPGDPSGPAWYYFEQFTDGNWMVNLNIPSPAGTDWHKLR